MRTGTGLVEASTSLLSPYVLVSKGLQTGATELSIHDLPKYLFELLMEPSYT